MITLDAKQTAAALPWLALVEALREGFINGCAAPTRHHHEFAIPDEAAGTLLLMPAWMEGEFLGVKQVLVIPENAKRGLSAVSASYQLSSAKTGELLAIIDGAVLTHRRTAAASALASSYLSRANSEHLLMVGTGGLAPNLIEAHCAVRPISTLSIWGRNVERSEKLAQQMRQSGLCVNVVTDLQAAAQHADIISSATLSEEPLICGDWIVPGTHVDLVGAFKPTMRESDDELIRKASVFVDTIDGALQEAGDIIQAIQSGAFSAKYIQSDLFALTGGEHRGRCSDQEITVFKSVGTALEDLAAAVLVYRNTN
jgi:ornithine cyclodeaminase